MKKSLFFLLLAIVFIGQSCLKNDNCNDCFSSPIPFVFTLLPHSDSTSLIPKVYKEDTIALYYDEAGQRKEVEIGFGNSRSLGICIVTTDISIVSSGKNIKTFYLYLNQFDTDTIYFDSKLANDGCCTFYSYDSLSYNGKRLTNDPESNILYALKLQMKP